MACVPGVQIDITGAVKLALKPLRTTARRIHVLLQLRRHVVALAAEMEELRDVKADIEADVHGHPPATTTKRMLSNQARRWTETVDSLDAQVRELERSLAGERSGLGGSWAKYRLSRRATRLRRRARELQEKGKRFGTFRATSAVTVVDAVEAVSSTWTSVVGGERALSEVRLHLADAGKGLSRLPRIHRWAEARKVSLLGNTIEDLPGELCLCAHLSTLFLNLNPLRALPGGFLVNMPSLRVLDMSGTDITELPREIGSLGRLQHLNLSGTRIESLPAEMAALSALRQLDLRETYELSRILQDPNRIRKFMIRIRPEPN